MNRLEKNIAVLALCITAILFGGRAFAQGSRPGAELGSSTRISGTQAPPVSYAGTAPKPNGYPCFAVKTNVLYDAAATPNLGFETGLGPKTSFDFAGGYNWFDWKENRKWKHWLIQPGVRWWSCERFNGHFFGAHLLGGEFNVGGVGPFKNIKNNRYDGWLVGVGVSYGYQWILSNRLAVELEAGVGYAYIKYDKFGCLECAPKIGSGHYNWFGPTKLSATFVCFLW